VNSGGCRLPGVRSSSRKEHNIGSQDFGALLFKPQKEIRDLQNALLQKQVDRLAKYGSHYRELFQALSLDKVVIKIAASPDRDRDGLVQEVTRRTRDAIEMTPEVRVVDKMEIFDPSATLKCQRIIDERPREAD